MKVRIVTIVAVVASAVTGLHCDRDESDSSQQAAAAQQAAIAQLQARQAVLAQQQAQQAAMAQRQAAFEQARQAQLAQQAALQQAVLAQQQAEQAQQAQQALQGPQAQQALQAQQAALLQALAQGQGAAGGGAPAGYPAGFPWIAGGTMRSVPNAGPVSAVSVAYTLPPAALQAQLMQRMPGAGWTVVSNEVSPRGSIRMRVTRGAESMNVSIFSAGAETGLLLMRM